MNARINYLSNEVSELSIKRCCELLGINRSRVYYKPKPETEDDIILKNKIYEIWDDHNNKGSRVISEELCEYNELVVNRKKVQRLMRELGIQGVLPKPNLSKAGDLQYKHPYYLSGMMIYMANQVWATDITYVKLPTGMMYIICLIDIFSRYIVGYVITNTLDAAGCIDCLNISLAKHGKPYIANSDQGSQYTSHDWVNALKNHGIIISMDAKGRWADNIFMERFWKTLKYECIFMLGIETVKELHKQVAIYINYYNNRRPHSALGYKTPKAVYLASIAKNEECTFYCEWPSAKGRTKHSKKTVRPSTMMPKEVAAVA